MQQSGTRSASGGGRDVREYLEIPLRRPWHVAIPFVLVLVAAVATSYILPPRYRSSTLILVESEKVPESFVGQVATERVGRRLLTVKQEVTSRTRLETVVRELDPYKQLDRTSMTDQVEWMRGSTSVTVRGNDAFGVEFVHGDRHMAQRVANRLAQLFIEETMQARKQQVGEAYSFIEQELAESRKQLEGREEALRRYKEQHMGSLPEQLNANLSTLQRLQLEQQGVADSLRMASDRLVTLENPAPKPATTGNGDGKADLTQLQSQLASLRSRYTDEHPDVQAVLGQIAAMERSAAKSNNVAAASATLEHARAEVKNFRERRDELALQIGRFQARVEGAPRVEQEIVTLTRDFNKLNENYLALLNKKLDAQLAAKLEQRWQGDRFRILDPASLPENPFFPNRLLFLLFGISAGLALGVGVALAADLLDQSFRSVRDLEDALPFPVLAAVPLIAPLRGSDVARKTRRGATTSLGLSASGGDVTDFMEARHVASRKRRGSK
jgi:polysaccharide chain length determinant protein (PEP-CTERM system associated)